MVVAWNRPLRSWLDDTEQREREHSVAIAAGSIDGKLGVTLDGHIFCHNAGDCYQITGG